MNARAIRKCQIIADRQGNSHGLEEQTALVTFFLREIAAQLAELVAILSRSHGGSRNV